VRIHLSTPHLELWKIENGFSGEPHRHDDLLQVTVPIYGTCHFSHEHRKYALSSGEAIVQHPNDRHHFHIGERSGVVIIQIRQSSLDDRVKRGPVEFSLRQQLPAEEMTKRFRDWSTAMLASDQTDPLALEETEARVVEFLFRSLRGNHEESAGRTLLQPADSSRQDRHMRRAIAFIHEHYRNRLTIETLAGIALCSRYHFIRSFKAATGETPYQYMLRLRIEEAQQLLVRSGETVTEISFRLGFSSTSQFYRAFCKWVGTTPEHYRNGLS
jgi:AraC family transcriptional regulator